MVAPQKHAPRKATARATGAISASAASLSQNHAIASGGHPGAKKRPVKERYRKAHEWLSETTGLTGEDLRLAKHRLIAGEVRQGYQAQPLPDISSYRLSPAVAAAFVAYGLHIPAFKPVKHTCQATTRRGTPCRALGLANGRCRNHGGLSTGPKTADGWERTRAGYRAWLDRQRQTGG